MFIILSVEEQWLKAVLVEITIFALVTNYSALLLEDVTKR